MSIEKSSLFAVRDGLPGDKNFILATMLRGLYYGDSYFSLIPKDTFMLNYHGFLEALLSKPYCKVTVACLKDDPEVILGYAITRHNNAVLDWVFVKTAWRNVGIAKSLVPTNVGMVSHLTRTGVSLLREKLPGAVFNPFIT